MTTFLLKEVPSGVKNATVLKKCQKTAKNGPFFFYKNNETSSLSFKKIMLSTESHYSAKTPQNMRYNEQNKFKKTLLFQIYHSIIFFWKTHPFYNFCQFFYDFWLYFDFDAKIKVYKRNLWSRWFFGMKAHWDQERNKSSCLLQDGGDTVRWSHWQDHRDPHHGKTANWKLWRRCCL